MHRRQRGFTLIGLLVVLAVVGFFAYLAMRLFPVYSEYYSVVSAMKGLAKEEGIRGLSAEAIRQRFDKRLYTSYVESVKPNNVTVITSGTPRIQVKYEVRRHLFGNIDFVASFDRTENLGG
jgi:prepilin-type N-terminal cleavage/methylation domain-containing protein